MTDLHGRRILLGVTGGVAAYKSAELVRQLRRAEVDVRVVLTAAAARFVTPVTFQALSGQTVWTDLWDPRIPDHMAHIELTRDRDLMVVAPASADFIGKLVNGLADDLLSTLAMARDCALMVAPAMNRQMWENPATRRNVAQLARDGVQLLGPEAGDQACGEVGMGRMLEPEQIVEAISAFYQPKRLAGRRVVVTAGPTVEPIDPVRMITNASSGRMGYAVARAAHDAGADVILISGPVHLQVPYGVTRRTVGTAREMFEAVRSEIAGCDAFFAVAAVSDYRVAKPSTQKIKKGASKTMRLALEENPDILAWVAARRQAPFCVGFAAESERLEEHARAKRARKGIPLIAANLATSAIGADDNDITLYDAKGVHPLGRGDKLSLARALIEHVAGLLPARKSRRA